MNQEEIREIIGYEEGLHEKHHIYDRNLSSISIGLNCYTIETHIITNDIDMSFDTGRKFIINMREISNKANVVTCNLKKVITIPRGLLSLDNFLEREIKRCFNDIKKMIFNNVKLYNKEQCLKKIKEIKL